MDSKRLNKWQKNDNLRIILFWIYVGGLSLLIFIPLFQLTMAEKAYKSLNSYDSKAYEINTVEDTQPLIYDSENTLLTKNISYYNVKYDNTLLPTDKDSEILNKFDQITNSEGKITEKFLNFFTESKYRHNDIVVFSTLDKNIISKIISSDISKYFIIEENINRDYIYAEKLSSVIGYYTKTSSLGLEAYFTEKFKNANVESVNLTINSKFQTLLYDEFNAYLNSVGITSGEAVFSNENGKILASVSLPSFNPNSFTTGNSKEVNQILEDKSKPMINRLYDTNFPSGSIMKLMTAISALESGKIRETETINSEGCMEISNGTNLCEFSKKPYGNLNVVSALRLSSNIYFCKLFKEKGLKIEDLNKYQQMFGLGKSVELEVLNEAIGVVPTPKYKLDNFSENWYLGDSCNSSIGQGFTLVNPAQMLRVVNVISTDGIFNDLHFVSHVLAKNGTYIKAELKSSKVDVSAKTFEIIKNGMRESAKINGLENMKVWSKTGTAETGKGDSPHTWLIGFYESRNFGKISFVIFLENGSTTKYNIDFFSKFMNKLENSDLKVYAASRI